MQNLSKLKATMRSYNIHQLYYTSGVNLDSEVSSCTLFFVGALNESFIVSVYNIYTIDGCPDDKHDIDIWMAPEGSHDFMLYAASGMDVLNI